MSVYAYCRVSTRVQAEQGESLDVQTRVIAGYAQMHGMVIDQTFIEAGVSGSVALRDRPKGKACFAILKRGDTVIASKLDRMFRSARDALDVADTFKERGISLHLIDLGGDVINNGMAKCFFTIVSAFAEAERDRIKDRIVQVKADQRARGRYLGGKVPFGYRVEFDPPVPGRKPAGTLVEIPEQQAAIATACAMRASGAVLREIREALVEQHGVKLSLDAVSRISERAA